MPPPLAYIPTSPRDCALVEYLAAHGLSVVSSVFLENRDRRFRLYCPKRMIIRSEAR